MYTLLPLYISLIYVYIYQETIHYSALLKRTDQRSCPNLKSIRKAFNHLLGQNNSRGQSISMSEDDPFDTAEMVGNSATTEERVQELITMFRLDEVADQKLRNVYEEGNNSSSSSTCALGRGRRRLLTIAQEIVNRPGLILLEDPMYELSWDESEEVACAILALSRGGRTIVCTLSNPAWSVLDAFDTTLLLGGGLQLYFGPRREAVAYFENIGYEKSKSKSPSEFLLEIAKGR
jgi:ABC-type multidrug transport system ATPase subunit